MKKNPNNWLEKSPLPGLPWLTYEVLLFSLVLLLAVITRFYNLGARAQSHDESLHTYFSYLLSQGQGYQHNPMMHGPLQFHLIALAYFLFGSSDFTARVPAALFGIFSIASLWLWRRYLGKLGSLAAATLVLLSPFLSYYSRYTREDSYIALSFFLMIYAVLRYFETGQHRFLYLISGAFVIHYLTKETSFIYNAEMLIFLALVFLWTLARSAWQDRATYRNFLITFGFSAVSLLALLVTFFQKHNADAAAKLADAQVLAGPATNFTLFLAIFGAIFLVTFILAAANVVKGFGLAKLRGLRSFDLLIVFGTLVLPQLSAFPVAFAGWDPVDYSTDGLIRTAAFLVPIVIITILIGVWWKREIWLKMALVFWAPYVVLYTTVFTNGGGFFTGIVGSLGYWIAQQGVQRGSQPEYYYWLLMIPMYEYLPAIASAMAIWFGVRNHKRYLNLIPKQEEGQDFIELPQRTMQFLLLSYWAVMSIAAFSIAGEKMPWLTFHMALPMTLLGGWGIARLIEKVDWNAILGERFALRAVFYVLFVLSAFGLVASLFQSPLPFDGKELAQLQATTTFLAAIVVAGASLFGIYRLNGQVLGRTTWLFNLVLAFAALGFLTARTMIRANYVLYDSPKEYLVYAHSYSGVKELLRQVDQISEMTVGGKNIAVAYDDDTSWPLSWYMREYPNNRFYGGAPDRSLKDLPAIIVGDSNYAKIEPILGDDFYQFDFIRMVWPNQDYFNLVSTRPDPNAPFEESYACNGVLSFVRLFKNQDYGRLCNALLSADQRAAIFDIWLNRDYTKYGQVNNTTAINEQTWDPADRMRLYVNKDIADKIWQYGVKVQPKPKVDPYALGIKTYDAALVFGIGGEQEGMFNAPRGVALAPDGSIYVTDSRNHRIQHFGESGELIGSFGINGDASLGEAPAGTFNEPWGVAVASNGDVFVSDTWNHRIQRFNKDGKPLKMWGVFGTAETPNGLYGPRGIAVSEDGRVFVADTGNKRIMVFDQNGAILAQFGGDGYDLGKFNEPTDVKLDSAGNVYVTDAWNQRVQVFAEVSENSFTPIKFWEIDGWGSQTLDNKPYLTIAGSRVFVTDPEGYRVLEFKTDGTFVQLWGEYGTGPNQFGLPNGIAASADGVIWIADAANNRILKFEVGR